MNDIRRRLFENEVGEWLTDQGLPNIRRALTENEEGPDWTFTDASSGQPVGIEAKSVGTLNKTGKDREDCAREHSQRDFDARIQSTKKHLEDTKRQRDNLPDDLPTYSEWVGYLDGSIEILEKQLDADCKARDSGMLSFSWYSAQNVCDWWRKRLKSNSDQIEKWSRKSLWDGPVVVAVRDFAPDSSRIVARYIYAVLVDFPLITGVLYSSDWSPGNIVWVPNPDARHVVRMEQCSGVMGVCES